MASNETRVLLWGLGVVLLGGLGVSQVGVSGAEVDGQGGGTGDPGRGAPLHWTGEAQLGERTGEAGQRHFQLSSGQQVTDAVVRSAAEGQLTAPAGGDVERVVADGDRVGV